MKYFVVDFDEGSVEGFSSEEELQQSLKDARTRSNGSAYPPEQDMCIFEGQPDGTIKLTWLNEDDEEVDEDDE